MRGIAFWFLLLTSYVRPLVIAPLHSAAFSCRLRQLHKPYFLADTAAITSAAFPSSGKRSGISSLSSSVFSRGNSLALAAVRSCRRVGSKDQSQGQPRATARVLLASRIPRRWSALRMSTSATNEEKRKAKAAETAEREAAEWDLLLLALGEYKRRFGNLRVPTRFQVPRNDSWPEITHDLKLGSKVAAIRGSGKYVSDDERRRTLDEMGFEWRLRRLRQLEPVNYEPFATLIAALEAFRRINGDMVVPKTFVVPRLEEWPASCQGLPLGSRLQALKSYNRRSEPHPYFDPATVSEDVIQGRIRQLQELGVKLKKPSAAKKSAQVESHAVELEAESSCTNGSSEARGRRKKSDTAVTSADDEPTRSSVEGEDSSQSASERTWEAILSAITVFKQLNGHTRIAQNFVVPNEEPWPIEARNLTLGIRVSKMRLKGSYVRNSPGRRMALLDLGVDLPYLLVQEDDETRRRAGSSAWDEIDDNDDDEDDFYASEGAALSGRRRSSVAVPLTADLNDDDVLSPVDAAYYAEHGWNLDEFDGDFNFDDVVLAFKEYKARYGDFDIPLDFVVGEEPTEAVTDDQSEVVDDGSVADLDAALAALFAANEEAPAKSRALQEPSLEDLLALEAEEELSAYDLDVLLSSASSSRNDDAQDRNGASERKDKNDEDELAASFADDYLKQERQFQKHFAPWPRELEGLKLGLICAGIRVGDILAFEDPERKDKLDSIGFDWGDPEARLRGVTWHFFLACLFSYSKIKGSLTVPWDYVIPNEEPWPLPLRGADIGRMTNKVREQENVIRTRYPLRAQLLDSMGFVFLPPVFQHPPLKYDNRLPPCLRLADSELEITRENRRRKSNIKAKEKKAKEFTPPNPGTPDQPLDYKVYTIVQLKEILRLRNLKVSAKYKQEYVDRLMEHDRQLYERKLAEGNNSSGSSEDGDNVHDPAPTVDQLVELSSQR